ncbi:MAG: membrane protein insertase YidC [Chitinophagales bacterium]|nr:MAG: membrane protein insertase YidC [Chitinophagales bacterium]
MDRNTVIGMVLIGILLVLFSMYNMREAEKRQKLLREQQAADSLNNLPTTEPDVAFLDTPAQPSVPVNGVGAVTALPDSAAALEKQKQDFGPFYRAANGFEQADTLENDQLRIVFTNKGARVKSVEVKHYMTHDSLPLILFDGDEHLSNLQFFINNNRVIHTRDLFFQPIHEKDALVFRLEAEEGRYLEQRYAFNPQKKYVVDYTVRMVGFDRIIPPNAKYLNLHIKRTIRQLEKSRDSENRYTSVFYKYKDDDVSSLSASGNTEESLSTSFTWVSFKQQFFNHTVIFPEGFSKGTLRSETISNAPAAPVNGHLKTMEASMVLPFHGNAEQAYAMSYYFGPNHYQTLKKLNIDLEEIVMVTGFMSWVSVITKWIIIPVFNFLERYISNYGVIIFILTLLIKIVLYPLSYKSFKSMAMMKVLQPELNALREKYKDDQQKFATEQWKLFQSTGVSPLGGCIPQLLQLPILIAMYYFFPTSIELRQEKFLWANDLSTYDSILNLPFTIPFYGDHVSLFTLLMTITSIIYAVTQPQMNTGQPGMKYIPYIFPIMLLGIFNSMPAALTYYYFLTNLLSYLQQWATKKFLINEEELHRKMQENKKKPIKKSKWQMRLEELARQQREMQNQKQKQKRK